LSGEFPQTSGEAFIAGFNTQEDQSKIRRKIGYCPQFDALLELLTVREHLELYARIKGVPKQYREQVVEDKLKQMDLTDFANKAAGSLSGGNKRKLSVAIAMIGEPSIIFLDEPSTGMDPVARRFMWEVIARISTQDRTSSIILTTHSMEEAEALCSRIGIMVNGKLRCLGSPQHLKAKFGAGYEVDLRTRQATLEELLGIARCLYEAGVISELPENETRLGAVHLHEPFSGACEALGKHERTNEIAPDRNGALLYDMFVADSYIPLRNFADWWLAEDFAAAVESFMHTTFPGVMLLERATAHAFRFRIPTADMPLPAVFDRFEAAKASVRAVCEVFCLNYSPLTRMVCVCVSAGVHRELQRRPDHARADF
jgi:ABC-type multidrug transport system ATPase subunit